MKWCKIPGVSILGIILLMLALPVVPAYGALNLGNIYADPKEGKIGTKIEVIGGGFDDNEALRIYFSSQKADYGGDIDDEVTAYETLGVAYTDDWGKLDPTFHFIVPDELTDGKDREYVHGGTYYIYATYYYGKRISAMATFDVIKGEIKLDRESGSVGSKVEISGNEFRQNQKISVEYDGEGVNIVSGDNKTDEKGQFTCAIIIPESIIGEHTITVGDESGDKPEVRFYVDPKITLDPASQVAGQALQVSGTGFGERKRVTITVGDTVIPTSISTNHFGSFTASFPIPIHLSRPGGATIKVEARDISQNGAEAQLTVLAIPASISLAPDTSLTSPGHVGMQVTVRGTSFSANGAVTITCGNGKATTVATATADASGSFSSTFTVPPSVAGSHTITATDGTNTATSVFIMESQAPLIPVLLLPEAAATAEAETRFDWGDVSDPGGVTYILQVSGTADFATILLEEKNLSDSEYTLTKEEKLKSTPKGAPYYWRVKVTDGAFNESEWATPRSFYVGFSWASIPTWAIYIWVALGVILLIILGFWIRKRLTER